MLGDGSDKAAFLCSICRLRSSSADTDSKTASVILSQHDANAVKLSDSKFLGLEKGGGGVLFCHLKSAVGGRRRRGMALPVCGDTPVGCVCPIGANERFSKTFAVGCRFNPRLILTRRDG